MVDQDNSKSIEPCITLFLSTVMMLPIVQLLQQKNVLAGVVMTPRVDADAAQLEQKLAQLKIPSLRYDANQAEKNTHNIQSLGGNVGLIVTFSVLLPSTVLDSFEFGVFNVHASDLPLYRGANPIFWQLKDGVSKSAVVIHRVEAAMDSGGIVASYKFDTHPLDTYGTLWGTAFQLIPVLIQEFLELFILHQGDFPELEQQGEVSHAPNPSHEQIRVDWRSMGAKEISALARACNPNLGGAQLRWKNTYIGLMQASIVENKPAFGVEAGVIIHIGTPEGLWVATIHGVLSMDVLYMMDGVFTGLHFAQRFSLNAGEKFLM